MLFGKLPKCELCSGDLVRGTSVVTPVVAPVVTPIAAGSRPPSHVARRAATLAAPRSTARATDRPLEPADPPSRRLAVSDPRRRRPLVQVHGLLLRVHQVHLLDAGGPTRDEEASASQWLRRPLTSLISHHEPD